MASSRRLEVTLERVLCSVMVVRGQVGPIDRARTLPWIRGQGKKPPENI